MWGTNKTREKNQAAWLDKRVRPSQLPHLTVAAGATRSHVYTVHRECDSSDPLAQSKLLRICEDIGIKSRPAWLVVAACLLASSIRGKSMSQPFGHNRSTGLVCGVPNLQLSRIWPLGLQ